MNLKNSFDQARQADIKQQELLKREVYKEQQIVSRIMNEIQWGESKKISCLILLKIITSPLRNLICFTFKQ